MLKCIELDEKLKSMDQEITVNPQFVQKVWLFNYQIFFFSYTWNVFYMFIDVFDLHFFSLEDKDTSIYGKMSGNSVRKTNVAMDLSNVNEIHSSVGCSQIWRWSRVFQVPTWTNPTDKSLWAFLFFGFMRVWSWTHWPNTTKLINAC